MKPELRAILDQIDNVLAAGDDVAHDLWAVLTGTRGPDTDIFSSDNKYAVTIPIRVAAFPKTTDAVRAGKYIGADFGYLGRAYDKVRLGRKWDHFSDHGDMAARALNIPVERE